MAFLSSRSSATALALTSWFYHTDNAFAMEGRKTIQDILDLIEPSLDHNSLSNLAVGDVHTQYALVDGTRSFTGVVGGITPTADAHLTTKGYVDGLVNGINWQDPVLNVQTDNTLDPGATPTTGDRYILEDVLNLNVNFGSPAGAVDDDIVEYNGSAFVVVFATSVEGLATVQNDNTGGYLTYNGSAWVSMGTIIDHGNLSGLGDDDHAQYALLLGRSGGQTLIGGTGASDDLTLESTSNAAKGVVRVLSGSKFEALDDVGLGKAYNGTFNTVGFSVTKSTGQANATASAAAGLRVNRTGSDGIALSIHNNSVLAGGLGVSGSELTFTAASGAEMMRFENNVSVLLNAVSLGDISAGTANGIGFNTGQFYQSRDSAGARNTRLVYNPNGLVLLEQTNGNDYTYNASIGSHIWLNGGVETFRTDNNQDTTFSGQINTIAGTISKSSLNIPSGVAESSPTLGDVYADANGIYWYSGSEYKNLANAQGPGAPMGQFIT